MPRSPTRILTFEEYTRTPRTPAEIECYHRLLAALQHMGAVDADLNIVRRRRATTGQRKRSRR